MRLEFRKEKNKSTTHFMDFSRHEDVKEGGDICDKKKKCDGPYMISEFGNQC